MDWTLVVTTLGAAGIAGASGYMAAWRQGSVALRQVEAENERLRDQHREDHFRHRQGVYHGLLNVEREFARAMAVTRENFDERRMADWMARFHHAYNAVMLFGTDHVREAASDLADAYRTMIAPHVGKRGSYNKIVRTAYDDAAESIQDARDAIITAMRADV